MISDKTATREFALTPLNEGSSSPSPALLSASPFTRTPCQDTFLYPEFPQHFLTSDQEQLSSSTNDRSPVVQSPLKVQYATIISPPHQQSSRTLEFPASSSSTSSSPSTFHTATSCNYISTCSPPYAQHQDQSGNVTHPNYTLHSSHCLELLDNSGNFFGTGNRETTNSGLYVSKGSITSDIAHSDYGNEYPSNVQHLHQFSFQCDINNNNSCINHVQTCHEHSFHDNNSSALTSGRQTQADNLGKNTRLPPFSALLSSSSVKQGSNNLVMTSRQRMFSDSDDSDTSLNSEEEEVHYTDLRNVGPAEHEQEHPYMDVSPELSILESLCDPGFNLKSEPHDPYESHDFSYLEPEVPFPSNPYELDMDSSTPDSDGYESSSVDRVPFSQHSSIINTADVLFTDYNTPDAYNYICTGHESPSSSDDGFHDGTPLDMLPDFKEIENPGDLEKIPHRKRTGIPPKEKRTNMKMSQVCADKERRKPGRKPGQVSNVLHLWEFMRDLLQCSENQGIIEWISKIDGVFRVINSAEVARLWGEKKKNKKKMTYEKLSRSLRYSRLEGYFADLPKEKNYPKKLCFKFGPKSKDWH